MIEGLLVTIALIQLVIVVLLFQADRMARLRVVSLGRGIDGYFSALYASMTEEQAAKFKAQLDRLLPGAVKG